MIVYEVVFGVGVGPGGLIGTDREHDVLHLRGEGPQPGFSLPRVVVVARPLHPLVGQALGMSEVLCKRPL